MAVTLLSSATTTLVINTPTNVDVAVNGVFSFHLDGTNFVAGDVFQLQIYRIELTAGTRHKIGFHQVCGAWPAWDVMLDTLAFSNDLTDAGSLRFEITQTAGTGRSVTYKVLQH